MDKASHSDPGDTDLDALLDDALNDFEESDQSSAPPSEVAPSNQATHKKEPAATLGKGLGKGLALKPQPRTKSKKPHTLAGSGFPGFGHSFGAVPPDIGDEDELSANFQRMMAELAHVDLSQDDVRRPAAEPRTPGDHDLAATLSALAANSGSFGAGPSSSGQGINPDMMDADMLSKLSEQLDALGRDAAGGGGLGGQQAGAPDDMSGLVDGIMQQLLAKDVLYQPIQEIGSRYPQWLADHRPSLNDEDFQRYSQQFQHIQEITKLYEDEPENYTKLVDLLQQMQSCGQPPQEIVDEMAPGLGALDPGAALSGLGGIGLPGLSKGEGNCCIQ